MNEIIKYFNKPCIISIVGNVNSGKSNLIYYIITELKKQYKFNLVTFGLKFKIEDVKIINSLEQLEDIRESLIILDEFETLFDLEDRKKRRQIEKTLRLINHHNNILILCGLPNNFKKFLSSKIKICFYKKSSLSDFINGSNLKSILVSYEGQGMGARLLNLKKDEVMVFDKNYEIYKIPYLENFDSKKDNKEIFKDKI